MFVSLHERSDVRRNCREVIIERLVRWLSIGPAISGKEIDMGDMERVFFAVVVFVWDWKW